MWFSNSEPKDHSRLIGCLLANVAEFTVETPIRDEITIFRVRKLWKKLFKERLMLDENTDFKISIIKLSVTDSIGLHCQFVSSFGRYAFWRLVSMQSVEVFNELVEPFKKSKQENIESVCTSINSIVSMRGEHKDSNLIVLSKPCTTDLTQPIQEPCILVRKHESNKRHNNNRLVKILKKYCADLLVCISRRYLF